MPRDILCAELCRRGRNHSPRLRARTNSLPLMDTAPNVRASGLVHKVCARPASTTAFLPAAPCNCLNPQVFFKQEPAIKLHRSSGGWPRMGLRAIVIPLMQRLRAADLIKHHIRIGQGGAGHRVCLTFACKLKRRIRGYFIFEPLGVSIQNFCLICRNPAPLSRNAGIAVFIMLPFFHRAALPLLFFCLRLVVVGSAPTRP